jgi:hypothetical protein
MTNNFDEELTVTLRERAGAVPPRPDLAGAAIRQAHGIRRRRRIAGGVAAAALVALAVPVGLQAGDALNRGNAPLPPASQGPDNRTDEERVDEGPTEITPSEVTVQLEDLPVGAAPMVPYLDGSQLIVDGEPIDLGVDANQLGQVAYAGGEVYYSVRSDEGELTLVVPPGGEEPTEFPIDAGPWSSPDGRYAAYLAENTLTAIDTTSGAWSSVAVRRADILQSVTFVGGDIYFTAGDVDPVLNRWRIGTTDIVSVDDVTRATAVSPDGELVADMYQIDDYGSDTRMTSLSTGEVLWETTDFSVLGFSPDGRFVWGASDYGDGYADTMNVVLDAYSGEVVMRLDSPRDPERQLSFKQSVFESDTTLLVSLEQSGSAALVRCDLTTGGCELTNELVDGVVPLESETPYRLTS